MSANVFVYQIKVTCDLCQSAAVETIYQEANTKPALDVAEKKGWLVLRLTEKPLCYALCREVAICPECISKRVSVTEILRASGAD